MIRVGVQIQQTVCCPTCGQECRVVAGVGTVRVTVYCSNPECDDKDKFFTVDRMLGRIVDVGHQ